MLLTKEVEIKPSGKSIQYYRDKGYNAKWREPLIVKVEDLSKGSSEKVQCLCDFCKSEIRNISYCDYISSVEKYGMYSCNKCAAKNKSFVTMAEKYGVNSYAKTEEYKQKQKEYYLEKYGCESYFQTEEFKEKRRKYNLEHYGVDNYAKTKECHEKMESTMERLYGGKHSMSIPKFKERISNTIYERYGTLNVMECSEVKEKICNTNVERYGVPNAMQSPEIRAKVNETLCKNGTQKTSKQQLYLHYIYGGEINYPISYYAADICILEYNLVIEYDGGGHDLRVTLGRLTQEEFDKKEIIRNSIIKKEGYKIITIKSKKDFLPSDSTLLQILSEAKQYFSETNHSWCTYDIDKSLLFNAEHKDGISYNFGELRIIKDSDIETIKTKEIKETDLDVVQSA